MEKAFLYIARRDGNQPPGPLVRQGLGKALGLSAVYTEKLCGKPCLFKPAQLPGQYLNIGIKVQVGDGAEIFTLRSSQRSGKGVNLCLLVQHPGFFRVQEDLPARAGAGVKREPAAAEDIGRNVRLLQEVGSVLGVYFKIAYALKFFV